MKPLGKPVDVADIGPIPELLPPPWLSVAPSLVQITLLPAATCRMLSCDTGHVQPSPATTSQPFCQCQMAFRGDWAVPAAAPARFNCFACLLPGDLEGLTGGACTGSALGTIAAAGVAQELLPDGVCSACRRSTSNMGRVASRMAVLLVSGKVGMTKSSSVSESKSITSMICT